VLNFLNWICAVRSRHNRYAHRVIPQRLEQVRTPGGASWRHGAFRQYSLLFHHQGELRLAAQPDQFHGLRDGTEAGCARDAPIPGVP